MSIHAVPVQHRYQRPNDAPLWWECGWRRNACERDECPMCGRIKRSRAKQIAAGKDPDSMEAAIEHMAEVFAEVREMLEKDAKRLGIDLNAVAQEQPKRLREPDSFPLQEEVMQWHRAVYALADRAEKEEGHFWYLTEAAADLFWYTNTIASKTYRQCSNAWEREHGDMYTELDMLYTRFVLAECMTIIRRSLVEISSMSESVRDRCLSLLSVLEQIERKILAL